MFNVLRKSGLIVVAAGTLFLSGCGGGGGGGTTSLPTLNVAEANATAVNGAEAVAAIFSGSIGNIVIPFSASAVEPTGFDPAYFMLDKNGPVFKVLEYHTQTLNATYKESYTCDYGGTMSFTESYTATHLDATVTFSNCAFDVNYVMDGKMRVAMGGTNYGETLTYMEISFPADFTITDNMYTFFVSAGSKMRTDYSVYDYNNDYYAGTMTSSVEWGTEGEMGRYDDLTAVFTQDYYSYPWIETYCYKSGRIYVNNLTASLDIDPSYDLNCNDPFYFEDSYLLSGSMRLIGAGGYINVNVTATDTITVTDQNGTDINVTL
ncbi:hypothetical protein LOH54_12300 [Sulfurimonas sp. HSL-3221]|uniref:hypothetical protein n=1 Tax=Sulfurimonadaceae TaxID=2771471 RepID=UPI001E33C905|nr:hypothetical protein [Sulfurimonas sp. HSL-3221]UFS62415.1 hypothetical protein LOH54_12300 [Sulfurimonas sp. HSL-3221]